MATTRDAMQQIVRYNARFLGAGRDSSMLETKLDKLCDSPFGFFRGTFHLFVSDWRSATDQPALALGEQAIVGDIHLENFGAYRAQDGKQWFDVNDFDESDLGPPALDLARVATSIFLSGGAPKTSEARVRSLVRAWHEAYEEGQVSALDEREQTRPIQRLLAEESEESRGKWLAKRVEDRDGTRRFIASKKYPRIGDAELVTSIEAGVRSYAQTLDRADLPTDWPRILDVAERVAGTGSLGRFRWVVLVESRHGKAGKERVLELKEALPSSLCPERRGDPAERVIAQQRRLQAIAPAFLGVAHVAGVPCSVRELQPSEAKADLTTLASDALDLLCVASGTALGRLHRRGGAKTTRQTLPEPHLLAQATLAFARRYEAVVKDDHRTLLEERAQVERSLGLRPR